MTRSSPAPNRGVLLSPATRSSTCQRYVLRRSNLNRYRHGAMVVFPKPDRGLHGWRSRATSFGPGQAGSRQPVPATARAYEHAFGRVKAHQAVPSVTTGDRKVDGGAGAPRGCLPPLGGVQTGAMYARLLGQTVDQDFKDLNALPAALGSTPRRAAGHGPDVNAVLFTIAPGAGRPAATCS